jgi:hypothetical protein
MSEIDSAALDAYVRRVVAEAPPLRQDQRDKLAALLAGVLSDPATDETSDT